MRMGASTVNSTSAAPEVSRIRPANRAATGLPPPAGQGRATPAPLFLIQILACIRMAHYWTTNVAAALSVQLVNPYNGIATKQG